MQPPVLEDCYINDLDNLVLTEPYMTELDPQFCDLRVRGVTVCLSVCARMCMYVKSLRRNVFEEL